MSTAHATFSRIAIFFVVLTLGVAQADPGPKTVGPLGGGASDVEIAFAHAPVHYQDTDDTFPWADYITKFDFDVNWRADDNWDNLMKHPLLARGYFSVVETCTHWFVVYGFFHPRDWTEIPVWWDTEHENDMEGVLAVVRKPGPSGPRLGQLEAIVTVAHTDFYSYVPKGSSFQNGAETIDGELNFIHYAGSRRPKTSQEPKGHGLKAWPFTGDFDGLDARDGIIYYPSRHDSDVPCSGRGLILAYLFVQTLIDSMDPDYGSGSNIGGLGPVFILGVAVIGLGIVIMIVQAIRRPAFFRGETLSLDAPASVRPKR